MFWTKRTAACAFSVFLLTTTALAQQTATGIVFEDANGNRLRDPGETGLKGIRVSNQRHVVKTDENGRYSLLVDDNTALFVVKPKGWASPLDRNNIPRYYYIHAPKGSPSYKYPGVSPTGPLPASVDFPLRRQKESKRFTALFLGDTQTTGANQTRYLAHDVAEELAGVKAAFGVTLGDVANNDLTVFPRNAAVMGRIGIPWHNVPGNHDMNHDAPTDKDSAETFRANYGPEYYSFDYGDVHFLVLENIKWIGNGYHCWLGPEQMEFVKNDLAFVPKDQLVVLMMHIPITQLEDKAQLFDLLKGRKNLFAVAGHTHDMRNQMLGKEAGWSGEKPLHHLINGTSCGGWWTGAHDEYGLPHSTMGDGTPNGYAIVTFNGSDYSFRYKATRRSDGYQMNVYAPEIVMREDLTKTEVVANIWSALKSDLVEMRVDGGSWAPMGFQPRVDPFYAAAAAEEKAQNQPSGQKLPNPEDSSHTWVANLPARLDVGIHRIDVRWKGDAGFRIFEVQ